MEQNDIKYTITFCPDGVHELDTEHVYKDIEAYENVSILISQDIKTGEQIVSWRRQEDTEEIEIEDFYEPFS